MVTARARASRKRPAVDDLHAQIDSINEQALALCEEYPDRAITLCRQNARLLQGTIYPSGRIRNQLTLGATLFITSSAEEAKEVLVELEPLCRAEGRGEDLAELHYQLALVYEGLSDYTRALLHAEESLQFCGEPESQEQAKAELLLGTIYLAIGMHDKALEQAFIALRIFQSLGVVAGISKSLNNIGTIYNGLAEYDRAIEFFQKSLAIKREIRDSQGVANTLNNIANILFWSYQEYDKALEYYQESLVISRAHGYVRHSARSLQHIGQVYVYLQQYDQAVRYSLEAIAMMRRIGNKIDLAYALMDLGFVYFHGSQSQKSIELIEEGLAIAEEAGAHSYINKGYNLLRQIYRETGDFENAVKFNEIYIDLQKRTFNEASDRRVQQLTIQFEVEKTRKEKELYRLRTEKLGQEMEHKSKELTTMAMYLMQKNEFLRKLDKLIEEQTPATKNEAIALLCSLQRQIRETIRGEKSWESFEQQFKLVHHDFIGRLSELYPTLTPVELKVSALLRMNLSTKEIADLLYQSPRSIESYRYRLRQKINLPSSINLPTFLASL